MLLATALALLIYGMCSTDVYCSKQTGSSSTKETITHHFFVSGIGQKKTVDAAKICGGAENVVKTEATNIRKWIARFYYFRHLYSAGSVCIAHNNCMSCPSIWATLSLLINILLSSFQLFLHSDQPLSEGEIIPFSGVCRSGGGCIIPAGGGGGFTHWLTDCFDVQPTTTSGNIITQASFSALASAANSFVYFASSAATSRWRICMSVIAAFASFSSLAFLSRWALWQWRYHGND